MSDKSKLLFGQDSAAADTEPVTKHPYVTPKLKEFGSIEELTHSGGSGSADLLGMQSGTGGMN